ncbi:MAG: hypothetical protein HYR51_01925 [Candidatus Rokubacteria bacterium]|nr:hypothetical protein [Candidatus Rokubacteria bacterium]
MGAIRRLENRSQERSASFESLTTEQVLSLHERHFGPLDERAKERMVDGARMHGWDRTWGLDGLAA